MDKKFVFFGKVFVITVLLFCQNLQARSASEGAVSKWTRCNGCSDTQKMNIAKSYVQTGSEIRVNVMDLNNGGLTTYFVYTQSDFVEGAKPSESRVFVDLVPSNTSEISANKQAMEYFTNINVGVEFFPKARTISSNSVGSHFQNVGYLVDTGNAKYVGRLLDDHFNSRFIAASNTKLKQDRVDAFPTKVDGIVVYVEFPDGSIAAYEATYEFDKIYASLDENGNTDGNGFEFDFKVQKLKDKDGNELPMSISELGGTSESVSNGAMGAWASAFLTFGVSYSWGGSGSGGSGGGTVSCVTKAGGVTCTLQKSN